VFFDWSDAATGQRRWLGKSPRPGQPLGHREQDEDQDGDHDHRSGARMV